MISGANITFYLDCRFRVGCKKCKEFHLQSTYKIYPSGLKKKSKSPMFYQGKYSPFNSTSFVQLSKQNTATQSLPWRWWTECSKTQGQTRRLNRLLWREANPQLSFMMFQHQQSCKPYPLTMNAWPCGNTFELLHCSRIFSALNEQPECWCTYLFEERRKHDYRVHPWMASWNQQKLMVTHCLK